MNINRLFQNKLVWQCFLGLFLILTLFPLSETTSAEYVFNGLLVFSVIGGWVVHERQDLPSFSSTFRKGFFYGLSLVWISFALCFWIINDAGWGTFEIVLAVVWAFMCFFDARRKPVQPTPSPRLADASPRDIRLIKRVSVILGVANLGMLLALWVMWHGNPLQFLGFLVLVLVLIALLAWRTWLNMQTQPITEGVTRELQRLSQWLAFMFCLTPILALFTFFLYTINRSFSEL